MNYRKEYIRILKYAMDIENETNPSVLLSMLDKAYDDYVMGVV